MNQCHIWSRAKRSLPIATHDFLHPFIEVLLKFVLDFGSIAVENVWSVLIDDGNDSPSSLDRSIEFRMSRQLLLNPPGSLPIDDEGHSSGRRDMKDILT